MNRKKKLNSNSSFPSGTLQFETLNHRLMLDGAGFIDPVFYGPTPYLSEADTPAGFVPVPDCDECVVGLETFEDNSLDFGLQIDSGQIIGPDFTSGLPGLTDSVDGDDGVIDGVGNTNNLGYSYFTFDNSLTITLPSLMQSAGLVWTDGAPNLTDVVFEAFDENGNSLGTINAGPIADGSSQGTTGEDRFFGISYGDGVNTGVTSIRITNVGGQGLEIDHVQFANCSECCDIDLELTKTVDATTVDAGDIVTWTIQVTNNAEAAESATGVEIQDVLPTGVTINGANVTVTDGSYSFSTGVWRLFDSLDPGETETLTIETTVGAGLTGGSTLTNTAQVIAADQLDVDSTPNNDDGDQSEDDEANASITIVGEPEVIDLELTKVVDATTVNSGDTVTWTISVTNNAANANVAATGVTITDILPGGVSVVSATPSGNGSFAGSTWSLNDPLAIGATETLTVVTTVDAGLAGDTMLINTAFVATANESDIDSAPGDANLAEDDADDAKVTVESLIDLEVTKIVDADIVEAGDTATWTVSVTNNAENANTSATGVEIVDVLPTGISIVSVTPSDNGSFAGNTWSLIDPLAPGATATLTVVSTIDDGLAGGTMLNNLAYVFAADQTDVDSTPGDDNLAEDDADDAKVTIMEVEEPLMLSGFSYIDTNNDGIFQEYELPLLGVEIQLMGTDVLGNDVNLTTFTDITGFYKFNELLPGTYMVTQTQPVQFLDGRDTLGNLGGDDSVNDKFTVELSENASEYNFGELGLLPEYVNKRFYLTSTPYTDWEYIDVRQSSVWYSFDLQHRSYLELNGDVSDGSATVEIFDGNMNLVATRGFGVMSSLSDVTVLLQDAGQYYMRVLGDTIVDHLSLDIVTPNVNVTGNQLIAVGTAGDDHIQLELGDAKHVLNINGLVYEYDAQTVTDLHIGAATGKDKVTVVGTELNDKASVIGSSGKLTSSHYSVHTYSFDTTEFVGGGGYDYTQVYGSLSNDRLSSLPGDTTLTTPYHSMKMIGFDRVDAYGRGGWDYASMYGTMEDDSFFANDHLSVMSGDGFHSVAKGFERVDAFGRGGFDTATLQDSASDDVFFSAPSYAVLSTGSRLSYVKGFESNTADFLFGGNDSARFVALGSGDSVTAVSGDTVEAKRSGRVDVAKHIDHLFADGLDFGFHVEDLDDSIVVG